jgi:predicted Zn-dependent peptidase
MQATFDEEVNKVCTNLISEEEYDKAQNTVEKGVIQDLSSVDGIASQLAEAYVYYGNTNSINESIKIYRSITREEIRDVARRYLKPDNRVVLHYVPADK